MLGEIGPVEEVMRRLTGLVQHLPFFPGSAHRGDFPHCPGGRRESRVVMAGRDSPASLCCGPLGRWGSLAPMGPLITAGAALLTGEGCEAVADLRWCSFQLPEPGGCWKLVWGSGRTGSGVLPAAHASCPRWSCPVALGCEVHTSDGQTQP